MKVSKRQLRQIIRESLPYRKGKPWTDSKVPVRDPVERAEDHLDRELTGDEIEAAMGWERADPTGDADFWDGYGDAIDGKGLPIGASLDYKAGWEDGKLNRVTEEITRRQLRQIIRESILEERKGASASDIARFKPQIIEWTEILIDDLTDAIPSINELSEKALDNIVIELADTISVKLVGLTSSMDRATKRRLDKKSEDAAHEKWNKERRSKTSGTKYWGTP